MCSRDCKWWPVLNSAFCWGGFSNLSYDDIGLKAKICRMYLSFFPSLLLEEKQQLNLKSLSSINSHLSYRGFLLQWYWPWLIASSIFAPCVCHFSKRKPIADFVLLLPSPLGSVSISWPIPCSGLHIVPVIWIPCRYSAEPFSSMYYCVALPAKQVS